MNCKDLDESTKENKGKNTTTKPSFRTWLLAFIEEDNSFGDLARDAKEDKGWKGASALSLEKRLHALDAYDEAYETFYRARDTFRQRF